MTRKLKISLLLGSIIFGTLLTYGLLQPRSRDSSETLSEFLAKPWNRTNYATNFEFQKRLLESDTNAFPELLKMLCAEDSVLTKAKMKINSMGFIKIGGFIPADESRTRAILGFGILRRSASPMIQVLTNMIERGEAAESAVDALCAIRDEAVTALIQVLRSSKHPELRRYTLHAIGKASFSRKDRYRMFLEALDDPQPLVRSDALIKLHGLLSSSGASVPASNAIMKISSQLSDSNESVRLSAKQTVERILELQKDDKPRAYRYE